MEDCALSYELEQSLSLLSSFCEYKITVNRKRNRDTTSDGTPRQVNSILQAQVSCLQRKLRYLPCKLTVEKYSHTQGASSALCWKRQLLFLKQEKLTAPHFAYR